MPRKWGFAPTSAEQFKSQEERTAFRTNLFQTINASKSGTISFDEWLAWSVSHIGEKSRSLTPEAAQSKLDTNPQDFQQFLSAACRTRSSPEYKELYRFLLDCFQKADRQCCGKVGPKEFDEMVEMAGAVPRKFGFAPPTAQTYKTPADRKAARDKMFADMDADGSGYIGFEEWLQFAYSHICEKAATLDHSLPGTAPPTMRRAGPRGLTIAHANQSKELFGHFIHNATSNKASSEYKELYNFLLKTFVESDRDFDGAIDADDFDIMVERAGAMPRKWGFAPTSAEQFKSQEERTAFRTNLFQTINASKSGTISFDEWLAWSVSHIGEKSRSLTPEVTQSKLDTNPQDFKQFLSAACRSRTTPEYKELYRFLLDCFAQADRQRCGKVGPKEFDDMVEVAGAVPRKFGFAPPSEQTYETPAKRQAARDKMFSDMDADRSGYIGFEEWLEFCYNHICEKAATFDSSLPGRAPPSLRVTASGSGHGNGHGRWSWGLGRMKDLGQCFRFAGWREG